MSFCFANVSLVFTRLQQAKKSQQGPFMALEGFLVFFLAKTYNTPKLKKKQ